MKQPIRRPLTALLSLVLVGGALSAPAHAKQPSPFLTAPVPASTEPAELSSDYQQFVQQLKSINEQLIKAKAAHRDAPLGPATTDLIIAGMALNTAGMQLDQGNVKTAGRDLRLVHERLRSAQLQIMPSRVSEARGIFLDAGAIPKTKAGIIALLDELEKAHFNMITPEVFRRGYTLWHSPLTDFDPEFAGVDFDVLGLLIDEAHKRNMEVHPWLWVFRVRSPGYGNPVLDKLPGIAATKAGLAEPRFISPASPEGRAFAAAIIKDLHLHYSIDGINLDYIRYDETLGDDDISVTKFKMLYFQKHGHYPSDLSPGSSVYAEWQLWREEQVNQMVKQIAKDLDIPIGVSVFRGFNATRLAKMQDWRHWADNRWINYVSHMLYTPDVKDVDLWLDWETEHGKRHDILYPTLGPLRFNSRDDLFPQLDLLRQRLIPGSSLFSLSHFDRATLPDLLAGPYRQPAILPHRNLPLAARREIDALSDWLTRLTSEPTIAPVVGTWGKRLHDVCGAIPMANLRFNPDHILESLHDVDGAVSKARGENQIDGPFADEIHERLRYPIELLSLHRRAIQPLQAYVPPSPPPITIVKEAKTLPTATIPLLSRAPRLDGQPSDVWKEAVALSDFFWSTGMARSDADTVVRVGYDTSNLYLRVEAEEFAMGSIKAREQQRDRRGQFTDDDRFDLVLQRPDGTEYTFGVNLNNAQFDAKNGDAGWNTAWRSVVAKQPSGWVVEMSVPWAALGGWTDRGPWKANLVRYRQQERQPLNCWAAPLAERLVPTRFGTWQFAPTHAAR